MHQRLFYSCLLLLLFTSSFVHAGNYLNVKDVPNPKTLNNTCVSDPDNILSQAGKDKLNQKVKTIEDSTTAQIAIVILDSIGHNELNDFATELYNYWGLGYDDKDNGLLILIIKSNRRIEFRTGYGLEALLPDGVCYSIQQKHMINEFRGNNYEAGLLAAIDAISSILLTKDNNEYLKSNQEYHTEGSVNFFLFAGVLYFVLLANLSPKEIPTSLYEKAPKSIKEKVIKIAHRSRTKKIMFYFFIPLFISLYLVKDSWDGIEMTYSTIYLYTLVLFIENRIRQNKATSLLMAENDPYGNYYKYLNSHDGRKREQLFFPIPFIFYHIYRRRKAKNIRNQERPCHKCNSTLHKLCEATEDAHLSKAQLKEEELNSIDHDVWQCNSCSHVEIYSYENTGSKHQKCVKCKAKSEEEKGTNILKAATKTEEGLREVSFNCKNCGHVRKNKFVIECVKEDTSSSDGGFSFFGSSDSGGSWGGGDTGGGGSGSDW